FAACELSGVSRQIITICVFCSARDEERKTVMAVAVDGIVFRRASHFFQVLLMPPLIQFTDLADDSDSERRKNQQASRQWRSRTWISIIAQNVGPISLVKPRSRQLVLKAWNHERCSRPSRWRGVFRC